MFQCVFYNKLDFKTHFFISISVTTIISKGFIEWPWHCNFIILHVRDNNLET